MWGMTANQATGQMSEEAHLLLHLLPGFSQEVGAVTRDPNTVPGACLGLGRAGGMWGEGGEEGRGDPGGGGVIPFSVRGAWFSKTSSCSPQANLFRLLK